MNIKDEKENKETLIRNSFISFTLNYFDIYCAIITLEKDILENDFIRFQLVKMKAEKLFLKKA